MRPTEEITIEQYRNLAQPRARAKRARPDIPRAPRDEPVGLTALLIAGWSPRSPDSIKYRLTKGALDTGLCEDLRTACNRAKELERAQRCTASPNKS